MFEISTTKWAPSVWGTKTDVMTNTYFYVKFCKHKIVPKNTINKNIQIKYFNKSSYFLFENKQVSWEI